MFKGGWPDVYILVHSITIESEVGYKHDLFWLHFWSKMNKYDLSTFLGVSQSPSAFRKYLWNWSAVTFLFLTHGICGTTLPALPLCNYLTNDSIM